MWQVPVAVAITSALAQGGFFFGTDTPPPGAVSFDEPATRTGLTLPAGGTLTITLPAIPASKRAVVTMLGLDSSDAANTRITTRVNGAAVAPEIAVIGSIGTTLAPITLPAPIPESAGDVFSLFLENLSAADISISARILGWIG